MNRINRLVTAALLWAGLGGCSPGLPLNRGIAMSKSTGTVRFEKTSDNTTRIIVSVKNLAQPEALFPPGYAYVGWVQSRRDEAPENVGALSVDDYRTGQLKTETDLRDFLFFVTLEVSSDAARPSGPPLLWAHRDDPAAIERREDWARLTMENPQ